MQGEQPLEDMLCSICMSFFRVPITVPCGHSYCRSCLASSYNNTHSCPICRQSLYTHPDNIKQNHHLARIISRLKRPLHTPPSLDAKGETVMLVSLHTSSLLLPYTRVHAIIELQGQSLQGRLERFVAKQPEPFHKFGVISKVVWLNKISFMQYECIVEGIAFCELGEEWVEPLEEEQTRWFKNCRATSISEEFSIDPQQFQGFLSLIKAVRKSRVMEEIFKRIDYHTLNDRQNSVGMFYSVMAILNIPDARKYAAITEFKEQSRMTLLKQAQQFCSLHSSSPESAFNVADANHLTNWAFLFAVLLIFMLIRYMSG